MVPIDRKPRLKAESLDLTPAERCYESAYEGQYESEMCSITVLDNRGAGSEVVRRSS